MPVDSRGKHHPNVQRAMGADKIASMPKSKPMGGMPAKKNEAPGAMETEGGGAHTTLHDHGDGTFHTETHDGERTEHPHIGHALVHMGAKHSPMAKHTHIHSEGGSHTMHHAGEDGQAQGPHDAANLDDLKSSMDKFLGEEQNEWSGSDYGQAADGKGAY